MMILKQDKDGFWTEISEDSRLLTHSPEKCQDGPCAIHNRPSDHPLKDAPLNWRSDRAMLERICTHGVGHPDHDSTQWAISEGYKPDTTHGCCGCCMVV